MKNIILVLMTTQILLVTIPNPTEAHQVSKNSVILNEVSELKTAQGVVFAQELIYAGGIAVNRSSPDLGSPTSAVTLRELRAPSGVFTFSRSGIRIEVMVVPMVAARDQNGAWHPVSGRWDFKFEETNSYKSVIHVEKGGDLDIAYQSTGMRLGNREKVVHYGLTGNPHAISLSRKRLKKIFASQGSSANIMPILYYTPPNDIILVHMELTSEGLVFQPIFYYELMKHKALHLKSKNFWHRRTMKKSEGHK